MALRLVNFRRLRLSDPASCGLLAHIVPQFARLSQMSTEPQTDLVRGPYYRYLPTGRIVCRRSLLRTRQDRTTNPPDKPTCGRKPVVGLGLACFRTVAG
jgi:hypothetical protein